jgi:hypothetical protein
MVRRYFTKSYKKFTFDATFTDGRSVGELSLEIQTELFRWYFTESCEIFITYATITDGLAVGELPLEIQTDYFVDKFLSRNVFFLLALSVYTTVNLFFLQTELAT